ncbi:hypothetical protein R1flu_007781 [Riccia fluitans]|uniref:Uncharacterized protein n=1 Tax=Riccia fluitans TaxID=41844 RepID=A0ABD1YZU3_9MARC
MIQIDHGRKSVAVAAIAELISFVSVLRQENVEVNVRCEEVCRMRMCYCHGRGLSLTREGFGGGCCSELNYLSYIVSFTARKGLPI